VFLWLDHWHPASYLLDNFGYRIVHDSDFSLHSKLDVIIKNGDWLWPHARSDGLVEVQSKLHTVKIGDSDEPVWNSRSGLYKLMFGYLGQAERGASDSQVVEDCLVSHFYPPSLLHSLASFSGCFGHKTTYEWLGLYRTDFVSFLLRSPRER